MSEGLSLLIFAEGTRSADGRVGRFKAGSFLLAIQAGLPIVPLAVIGTRQVMPKGRLRTEPADVRLIVHDPIAPPAIAEPTTQDAKALADRVHAIVADTVDKLQNCRIAERRKARRELDADLVILSAILQFCNPAMFVTAIIAAGGRGLRFGGSRPKQLLAIDGRTLLERSVEAFLAHPSVNEVVVALPPDVAEDPPAYLQGAAKPLRLVAGGARRQDSVSNAFRGRRARRAR